jgi:serine protease Do
MSSENDNRSTQPQEYLPVVPDYDLLEVSGRPEQAPPEPAPEICINICHPNRNREVATLSVIALTLVAVVVTAAVLIISKSAVITTSDGKLSLLLGRGPEDSNPFAAETGGADPAETDNNKIDIKDPPVQTETVEDTGELTVSEIAEKVTPSVVSILVQNQYKSGLASGIILDVEGGVGYIVTNYHVVADMTSIIVVLNSGARLNAAIQGLDESSDLAVIKVDATGQTLTKAVFGNSDAIDVGDLAVAIGTPYDLSLKGTATAGIISAIRRDIVINNRSMTLIQTDASVNFGNSGGPLINKYGQIIGIVSAKIGEEYEGLGFAIPMNTAKPIIEALLVNGYVSGKPTLGINGIFLNQTGALAYNVPVGLLVTYVNEQSDAYLSGLSKGDVITAIDGVTLADLTAFNTIMDSHSAGDKIVLKIYRDTNFNDFYPGTYIEITVTLMDQRRYG